jgi:predicted GNAT family N-acyltransferase
MGVICDLKLVLCIGDEFTRHNFLTALQNLATKGELAAGLPSYRIEMTPCETPIQVIDCLHHHLTGENCAAILFFDTPSDPVFGGRDIDSCEAPCWVGEVCDEFKGKCATIAIMQNPRRVRNIDRVIGRTANSEQVLDTLKLVADKLVYTTKPTKRTLPAQPEVRLIRKQHELLDYFKLRHRIYKIMGYLEEEIENAASQMEINWCDKIALHIGAYEETGEQHESLVGTARVVVGTTADARKRPGLLASYDQWVTTLASQDPVLQQALIKGVLPLQLPIFQSQKLFNIFLEVLKRDEVCGELSRVIVREDYRGTGLSSRLVEFALAEAAKVGVNRMFLECLDIHESMYERLGFKRIPGTSGTVISVNQTMVAMELSRPLGTPIPRAG